MGSRVGREETQLKLKCLLLLQSRHWIVALACPCWYLDAHSHLASALSHYTSCTVLWVPMEKTMHLPLHKLSEVPREGQRVGAQPNPLTNTEPPPATVQLSILSQSTEQSLS